MLFHITNDMLEEDLQENLEEDDGKDGPDLASMRVLNQQRNELLARHKIECGNVEALKVLVDKLELAIYRLTQENARLKERLLEPDPKVRSRVGTREPDREEAELEENPRRNASRTLRQTTLPRSLGEMEKDKRSAKIPDSPLLTDGVKPNIDDWLSEIAIKLQANADHYETEELRIAYVSSRMGDEARPFIRERMDGRHARAFVTSEEILTVLERALGKPKEQKRAEAKAEFKKLYQKQEKFSPVLGQLSTIKLHPGALQPYHVGRTER